jgi:hypothetical protein
MGELIELTRLTVIPAKYWKQKQRGQAQEIREGTGEHLLTEPIEGSRLVHYPIGECTCPNCKEQDALMMGFEPDAACPQCGAGTLSCGSILY